MADVDELTFDCCRIIDLPETGIKSALINISWIELVLYPSISGSAANNKHFVSQIRLAVPISSQVSNCLVGAPNFSLRTNVL